MYYEDIKYEEKKEIVDLFANWLKNYTGEIVVKVMARQDEIIKNDFAIQLLRELKTREEDEAKNFQHNIRNLFDDYEIHKKYNPHNDCLSHAGSYRNVLYDMYIKEL